MSDFEVWYQALWESGNVMRKNKKVNKNIILGFIASYLLVVLLVFTAQYISNSVVLNALKSNALDIVKNSFNSNVAIIEQNLDRVKETAVIVAQNTAARLENVERSERDFYSKLTSVKKELSSYYVGNAIIKDICIQNDVRDYLVNFDVAYSRRLAYYETMITSEKLTPQELLKASENANGFSTENACTYVGGIKAIPFVFPTPILKARTGSVLVYVDEKTMLMPLKNLLSNSNGAVKIFDKDNVLLAQDGRAELEFPNDGQKSGNKKRIGRTNYYVLKEEGTSSGWSYVALLPESYVLRGVRYYQLFSLVFNFLVLLLGFAICLFFTVRKSNSYLALLKTLGIQPEKFGMRSIFYKDEYTGLNQHISKIKDENTQLLEKGNQNLLRKILNGQFEKSEDIRKELRNHKMEFDASQYVVMVIRNTGRTLPEENVKNFEGFMLAIINEVFPKAKVCFIRKNITAVIFAADSENYTALTDLYISRMERDIFARYHLHVLIGLGEKAVKLTEISNSYKEACEVVDYNFLMDGQGLYYYADLPKDDNYYYPIEIENALFRSVLESNFESARDVLRKIKEENFAKRNLCVSAVNELLAELKASIKKICRMQTEYLEFSQEECSVNHFFEHVISIIYMLCADKDAEKETQSRGQKICREIRNYIELHYSNSNLSLELIADEFRIHPNYLSTLFKKHSGCNLAPYIENIRIERAAELLSSGKYTVNEVAVSVGFTNDSTFRRRFKKIKGVPPSNYIKYE